MDEGSTCQQVLKWNRRLHSVHGRPHDHVCKLDRAHPVDEGIGVGVRPPAAHVLPV